MLERYVQVGDALRTGITVARHAFAPARDVVRSCGWDPDTWSGRLVLDAWGGTGELIIMSSYVEILRKMLPKASFEMVVPSVFVPLVEGFGVGAMEMLGGGSVLHQTQTLSKTGNFGFTVEGNNLAVSPYRGHDNYGVLQDDVAWKEGLTAPFYALFGLSMGVVPLEYAQPVWKHPRKSRSLALVFPSRNANAFRRLLPFTAAQWDALALALRRAGLEPVAVGLPSDPWPESMPGWERVSHDLVGVVDMIYGADLCLGFNSGIVWSHGWLRPDATTVMLDETHYHADRHRAWEPSPFGSGFQIVDMEADGSKDREAFEKTLAAAEAL